MIIALCLLCMCQASPLYMFVGSFTIKQPQADGKGSGICLFELNEETGALSNNSYSCFNTTDPTYLAVSSNGRRVYSVNDLDNAGFVSSFSVRKRGQNFEFLKNETTYG